jgi:hypothetical protein
MSGPGSNVLKESITYYIKISTCPTSSTLTSCDDPRKRFLFLARSQLSLPPSSSFCHPRLRLPTLPQGHQQIAMAVRCHTVPLKMTAQWNETNSKGCRARAHRLRRCGADRRRRGASHGIPSIGPGRASVEQWRKVASCVCGIHTSVQCGEPSGRGDADKYLFLKSASL